MNPIAIVPYFLPSAVIVLSFFFSVRCLFVHEMRLEAWRSPVKHIIYVDRVTFRRIILIIGCLCLMVFLVASYFQFLQLLERY
ncbi:MAG: hypothetical protein AB3N33_11895 [Puniceicoccaceae bacterium]